MKNLFERTVPKPPQTESKNEYIDPATDGWQKTKEGYWTRITDGGVEYLGLRSKRGVMTPEHVQAYYDRRKELERRAQEGNAEAAKELKSVNEQIQYLERYGPAVMGGAK